MDIIIQGLITSFSPINILLVFLGTFLGVVVGALPGIGPAVGISLLIPFTYGLNPVMALILAGGIYTGGIYGGSLTSILIGVPDSTNAATVLDGYPMAKQGKSLEALGASTMGSGVGGFFSALALMFFTPLVANLVMKFGVAEQFMIAIFGLSVIALSAKGSVLKGIISGLLGLAVSTIGFDSVSGASRFTFGLDMLADGVPLMAAIIGLFGIAQTLSLAEEAKTISNTTELQGKVSTGVLAVFKYWWVTLRATLIGIVLGATPGVGAAPANMIAYTTVATKVKEGEIPFGEGNIKGVIAPETANNATVGTALIPTLAFGIPGSTAGAVIMGLLMLQGVPVGPKLFLEIPLTTYTFFWALIFSNIALVIICLPLLKYFAKVTVVPFQLLIPTVLMLCVVGIFSIRYSMFDVVLAVAIGIGSYFFKKAGYPSVCLVLGLILGRLAEQNLSRSLMIYGDYSFLYTRPITLFLVIATIAMLFIPFIPFKKIFGKYLKVEKQSDIK